MVHLSWLLLLLCIFLTQDSHCVMNTGVPCAAACEYLRISIFCSALKSLVHIVPTYLMSEVEEVFPQCL